MRLTSRSARWCDATAQCAGECIVRCSHRDGCQRRQRNRNGRVALAGFISSFLRELAGVVMAAHVSALPSDESLEQGRNPTWALRCCSSTAVTSSHFLVGRPPICSVSGACLCWMLHLSSCCHDGAKATPNSERLRQVTRHSNIHVRLSPSTKQHAAAPFLCSCRSINVISFLLISTKSHLLLTSCAVALFTTFCCNGCRIAVQAKT
jgi:hypothetical protein